MAGHVQVVLREDVDNLGSTGELVRVRPGYARNYLLPRGMAVLATRVNIRQVEHEKALALKRAKETRAQAEGIAAALAEAVLEVAKPAGEEGKLYGSVTAADVAAVLKEKGYDVDRRKIQMPKEPIKLVGQYELTARLAAGIHQSFKIDVVAQS